MPKSAGGWTGGLCLYICTVEPQLSDPYLSLPLIIWNDVWKFLKQIMLNC